MRARLARLMAASGHCVELADSTSHARRLLADKPVSLAIVHPSGLGADGPDLLGECRAVVGPTLIVGAGAHATDGIDPDDPEGILRRIGEALAPQPDLPSAPDACLGFAGFTLDLAACVLRAGDGREISLTRSEWALLRAFVRGPDRALSRETLSQAVGGRDTESFERGVDMLVLRLRRKIEADPKHPRLIVTVPGVGYRFSNRTVPIRRTAVLVPEAERATDVRPSGPALPAQASTPGHPPLLGRRGLGRMAWPLAAAFGLSAAGFGAWRMLGPTPVEAIPALVVLPFAERASDRSDGHFGVGLADEIATVLATFPELRVVPRRLQSADHRPDARSAAGALGAQYALDGAVERSAARVRVTAHLIRVSTGEQLWASRFDKEGADILALQSDIADLVYESLAGFRGRVEEEQGRDAWRRAPPDLREYDFYLRGYRYFFNFTQEDNAHAREIWQQGLEAFPRSLLLRIKIAWTYVIDVESI